MNEKDLFEKVVHPRMKWPPRSARCLCLSFFVAFLSFNGVIASTTLAPGEMLRKHLRETNGVSEAGGYSRSFLNLDHENGQLFGGEDVLEADSVCQCQGNGQVFRILKEQKGSSVYTARVALQGSNDPPWTVVMHKEEGGWKFFDVIDSRGSNRALLLKHNTCARRKLAAGRAVDSCAKI
jgi:hypothetical protein